MSAERRSSAKALVPSILLFAVPAAIAIFIGVVAPIEGGGAAFLAFVLVFPLLAGLGGTIVNIFSIARAPAVVRGRICRSKEPMNLGSFTCPKCGTANQGPFQKSAPECGSCWTKVIGVVCWRCGTEQAREAFDGEEPRTEYTCVKCGQVQDLPGATAHAWWR